MAGSVEVSLSGTCWGGRIHFVISDNLNNYICRVLLQKKKKWIREGKYFLEVKMQKDVPATNGSYLTS